MPKIHFDLKNIPILSVAGGGIVWYSVEEKTKRNHDFRQNDRNGCQGEVTISGGILR
jgi:hypothetical protein